MQLREVSFSGVTRFQDPVKIDFGKLGDGLIAFVGRNGEGKTSAMETVAAGLFRSFPSRPGSVYDSCHGRRAFIELVFDDSGTELRTKLLIDAEQRKSEGYLTEDGVPITRGKSDEFDEAIERRFGSIDLFLASVFAAQNKAGNLLGMKPAERKNLFAELLGLGRFQVLAQAAGANRAAAEVRLSAARSLLQSVEKELDVLPEVERQDGLNRLAVEAAEELLQESRKTEMEALRALAEVRSAADRYRAFKAAEDAAHREEEQARSRLAAIAARPEELEKRHQQRQRELEFDRAAEEAQARLTHAATIRELGAINPDEEERRARARHGERCREISAKGDAITQQLLAAPDFDAARKNIQSCSEAKQRTKEAQEQAALAESRRKIAQADLEAAQRRLAQAIDNREKQLEDLRRRAHLIASVPCGISDSWTAAGAVVTDLPNSCPLLSEAREAKVRIHDLESGESCPAEREEVSEAQKRFDLAQTAATEFTEKVPLPALLTDIEAREQEARSILAQEPVIKARVLDLQQCTNDLLQADREFSDDMEAVRQKRMRVSELKDATDQRLKTTLKEIEKKERLTKEARENEERQYQIDLATCRKERSEANLALEKAITRHADAIAIASANASLLAINLPHEEAKVRAATFNREESERELRTAEQALATTTAKLAALKVRASEAAERRAEQEQIGAEVSDFSLLENALGKNGIQALEIDAAGPEIAALTNELLSSCYGPRFQISFETLRAKKSAKGEYSESFEVKVYDSGQERPAEALSGGEKVVVGEAIGLALAIFNARKSGVKWETLWRDETAGALDPDNAQRYVLMLRRAMDLGGFRQVIFVAHQPEVWESADVQLLVHGGQVGVQRADERRAA